MSFFKKFNNRVFMKVTEANSETPLANSSTYFSFTRRKTLIERCVSKKSFWAILISLFFAFPIIRSVTRVIPNNLSIIGKIHDFRKVIDDVPFGQADLVGKTNILIFHETIFSQSQNLEHLRKINKRLQGVKTNTQIVLFSNRIYSEKADARSTNEFLSNHGINPMITRLIHEDEVKESINLLDFNANDGKSFQNKEVLMANINTNQVYAILVDQKTQIRKVYEISNRLQQDALMIDVGLLSNQLIK